MKIFMIHDSCVFMITNIMSLETFLCIQSRFSPNTFVGHFSSRWLLRLVFCVCFFINMVAVYEYL